LDAPFFNLSQLGTQTLLFGLKFDETAGRFDRGFVSRIRLSSGLLIAFLRIGYVDDDYQWTNV
jgi:hypothetical protein